MLLADQLISKRIRDQFRRFRSDMDSLQICGGHLPDQIPEFGKNTLTKRAGQPAELEDIYIFLASDESGYITAEIFGINKGFHI